MSALTAAVLVGFVLGVTAFGDSAFLGPMGAARLVAPVVGGSSG